MEEGLHPFVPMEPKIPQDGILMNDAGTMYRVRVKGTSYLAKETDRKSYRYKIQPVTGNTHKLPIDCAKLEVLAAYVEPTDSFYIIPCLELHGVKSVWLYPHREDSKAKYEQYKEAWELFRT